MTDRFYNTAYEEQESIINIDYSNSELSFYTSKESICNRMTKKIGQPTQKYYTKEKISGARWNIPFSDKKKITAVLSRPTLIGNIK